jgi:hypothetical protein
MNLIENLKNNFNFALEFFKKYQIISLFIITEITLFFRRPGQFLYPYIWCEEKDILAQYLTGDFFCQINGYYIAISSFITQLSFKISFWYYPETAAFLTNLFILGVIFAIAYSPTKLKYPYLCAIAVLLIKYDSECFMVSLYNFWWAGILLILTTVWQDGKNLILRIFFVLLGGFSSPLILAASPLLIVDSILTKTKHSIIAAGVSIIPLLIQCITIFKHADYNVQGGSVFEKIVNLFYGVFFFISDWLPQNAPFILTFVFIILIIAFSCIAIKRKESAYCVLLVWFIFASAFSVYRIHNIDIISPFKDGPRYFFYPFVIMQLLIIYIIAASRPLRSFKQRLFRKGVNIFLVIMMCSFLYDGSLCKMSRDQIRINWRQQLANVCNLKESAALVNWDGYKLPYWHIEISPQSIKYLTERSLVFNNFYINIKNVNDNGKLNSDNE